jgi:mitochondrial fission protein ELM1
VTKPPRIWALLGAHAGDNNQVLALAEALGLPFETKHLRYNPWRHLKPRILGSRLRSLDKHSRALIAGEPPDLTISTGHRSVPVVQHLRRRSDKVRSVHIGYPRIAPDKFDLVVATPEYPVPDGPKLMRIPFALTRRIGEAPFDGAPRPLRLLILGGPTLYWRFDPTMVRNAVAKLLDAAAREGGSLIVIASPRTPATSLNAVTGARVVQPGSPPSYASLLAGADQLFVTADSVAMVSDAIATGKPVGLIPIEPTLAGRAYMAVLPRGTRMRPRDLRFIWKALADQQLVGTMDEPPSGSPPDINAMVADRVRALLSEE